MNVYIYIYSYAKKKYVCVCVSSLFWHAAGQKAWRNKKRAKTNNAIFFLLVTRKGCSGWHAAICKAKSFSHKNGDCQEELDESSISFHSRGPSAHRGYRRSVVRCGIVSSSTHLAQIRTSPWCAWCSASPFYRETSQSATAMALCEAQYQYRLLRSECTGPHVSPSLGSLLFAARYSCW